MELAIKLYVTLMPVILAGILNMIVVKLPILKLLKKPIDNNMILSDGKRLFGDNKTWKGFIFMIIFGGVSNVIWGYLCMQNTFLNQNNLFYANNENTLFYNLQIGLLLGLAYILFELPNSFLKRRVEIKEGKSNKDLVGKIFVIVDQVDSLFGCGLVLMMVYPLNIYEYLFYIFLGGVTHYVFNVILYTLKLRKNI